MLKYGLIVAIVTFLPITGNSSSLSKSSCDDGDYLKCVFPDNCQIGTTVTVTCTSMKESCQSGVSLKKEAICSFCWQTDENDHDCEPVTNCSTSSMKLIRTKCTVHPSVICIGYRSFYKKVRCNWSSGISWTKTMLLSVVLGGFGADRFYLGLWKSAIGKLFSFGGLGVWTIVDVVLISVGYIKPADGSLYI